MKFSVVVKNVKIEVDSRWNEKAIERVLEALAHTIAGVDAAGAWSSFKEKMEEATFLLLKELEQK